MNGLSEEMNVRASFLGWTAARDARSDPAWRAWLLGDGEAPISRCYRDGRYRFAPHTHGAVDAMARAFLRLHGAVIGLGGRLFVVGDDGVSVWQGGELAPARLGLQDPITGEDRRSRGGLFLVGGDAMGGTLGAAGTAVEAPLPETPSEWLTRWFGTHGNLGKLEERVEAERRGACFQAVLALAKDVAWAASWDGAWAAALAALCAVAERPVPAGLSAQLPQQRIVRAVFGEPTASAGPAPAARTWEAWAGQSSLVDGDLPDDSGLEAMFQSDDVWRRAGWRDVRLACLRDAGSPPKFARVAPVPWPGSKRPGVRTPGLPVLDALWAVRAAQECFPGRLSATRNLLPAEGPHAWIRSVELAQRAEDGGADDDRVALFGGEDGVPDLVGWSARLWARARERKEDERFADYYVVIRAEGVDEPLVAPFAFPLRRVARDAVAAWGANVRAEQARLDAVEHGLRELRVPERHGSELIQAVVRLRSSAAALADAPAGAPLAFLAGGGASSAVAEWLDAWEASVRGFDDLFRRIGNLAGRVSAGPLATFLDIGTAPPAASFRFGADALIVHAHHPLRIRAQLDSERRAMVDLADTLQELSSLREVPLQTDMDPGDVPAALWRTDQAWVRVASEGPFRAVFLPLRHPAAREPDLVEPLRGVLGGLAQAAFPGFSRRATVRLHASSDTDGMRPLLLGSALSRLNPPVARGVDLLVDTELGHIPVDVDSLDAASDVDVDEDRLAQVRQTMTQRPRDDLAFPLEVRVRHDTLAVPDAHVALCLRPCARRGSWVVRVRQPEDWRAGLPLWDADARAWDHLRCSGTDVLSQLFDALVVRRMRGEEDATLRVLGLSLETEPSRGATFGATVERAAAEAVRVVVVDGIWGAEPLVFGPAPSPVRVTFADFDRKTGWRTTVIAHDAHSPEREAEAARRGMESLFPGVPEPVSALAFPATHRAVPSALLHLWSVAQGGEPDAEVIGHLGVALFAHPGRGRLSALDGPHAWLADPFPPGALLLSMDSLQRWTWTRSGGTRGDFLALVPRGDRVVLLAIESKGSGGEEAAHGVHQALTARDKLRSRFAGPDRARERRELLRCVGEESFRADAPPDDVAERLAKGRVDFGAVCVSTARQGARWSVQDDRGCLWVRASGGVGLAGITGQS